MTGEPKRPTKADRVSVAKFLRDEARNQRGYADGDRLRAVDRTPDIVAYLQKTARLHEAKADRLERIADWMVSR